MTLAGFIAAAGRVPFMDRGRDYFGWDCWGLLWCAYRDIFGIVLPSYASGYSEAHDRSAVQGLITKYRPDGWREIVAPMAGDAVLMRVDGAPVHIGMMISEDRFIHVRPKAGTTISATKNRLQPHRIEGFYRHDARSP